YLAEYLARTQGKKLGIVTTADVFDATPAALAVHTQDRGAGTGIVDQYFDDRGKTGLTVLMGGGRKWFLPSPTACPDPSGRCGVAAAPPPAQPAPPPTPAPTPPSPPTSLPAGAPPRARSIPGAI